MSNDTAIKVKGLSKTYKLYGRAIDRLKEAVNPFRRYHSDFHALHEIDFEVKKGEIVGIIGKNGSGKSTLLKIITGVLTPSSGEVCVNGTISSILELGAGFDDEMTGMENLYLNLSINGMSKKESDDSIVDIINFAEIGDFINQPMKLYSSGMKARLSFAFAISVKPDILIIDEALSVGDSAFVRKCFSKMEEIIKRGTTILFVSHIESNIVRLCSRAIWLSNGKQMIDGIPKLVTGLYLKNMHEKSIDKERIVTEYNTILSSGYDLNDSVTCEEAYQKQNDIDIDYYSEGLKPKSTIHYDERGVTISDVKIVSPDKLEKNILIQGKEYIYQYQVEVREELPSVRFGFAIKNRDGYILSGGSYSMAEQLGMDVLKPGRYHVKWHFKCVFNEGDYYLNSGCSSDNVHQHRILDAYSFRVLPIIHRISTGDVNCITNFEVTNA